MGTVTKALSLLEFFSNDRSLIGLSEMARLSGMNKATVYRMLGELQSAGYVEQNNENRTYRLGPTVLRLARLREQAVPLVDVARPMLSQLCQETGETAHVSILIGHRLSSVAHAYSPKHATRVMMEDAEHLSFHGTASGLAVLAFADQEYVDHVLSQPLVAHTPDTVTDPVQIRAALPRIRTSGYAEAVGSFESEVRSFGAPILNEAGQPIGAISVAAPSNRVTDELARSIPERVKRAANTVTEQTGGQQNTHMTAAE